MAVTASDIKKLSSELATESNSKINIFLGMATRCVNAKVWGDKTDDGISLLTAHFIAMANKGSVGGSITKEKIGDLEVSYSNGKPESNIELSATSWGQLFLSLRRTLVITPMVVSCPE